MKNVGCFFFFLNNTQVPNLTPPCVHRLLPITTHTHKHTQMPLTLPVLLPSLCYSILLIREKKFRGLAITQVFYHNFKGGKLEQLCQDGHMGRNCTLIGCTYVCDSAPCTDVAHC